MTIPQIISAIGWPVFGFAVLFLGLHTFNLAVPSVDFYIPSSRFPVMGFVVAIPAAIIGLLAGIIGFFFEELHERWLEDD
jgi:hypothetical protein